jgi:Ca2+-dependent lipid-binding protein
MIMTRDSLGLKSSRHHNRLGHKSALGVGRAGVKQALDHSEDIERTAGKVGDVAGQVAKYAGMGAAAAAATGIGEPVAAGLLGIAGAAEGVKAGAGYVQQGAGTISKIKRFFN